MIEDNDDVRQIEDIRFPFALNKAEFLALFNLAMFGAAVLTGNKRAEIMTSEAAHVAMQALGEERWNKFVDRLDARSVSLWPLIQTTYRKNKENPGRG